MPSQAQTATPAPPQGPLIRLKSPGCLDQDGNIGHPEQYRFVRSQAKRKVIRAGRRGGKTTGVSILAVEQFLAGRRILYATPTSEQLGAFWFEVTSALQEPIDAGVFRKNETEHYIDRPGTKNRIKAKTAWNADTLRGDSADLLILDEFQLMNEDAWEKVGAPMLLDNGGDAVFIYTPPSMYTRSTTKARDAMHAAKFYKAAVERIKNGDDWWEVFHFSSHDNPTLDREALDRAQSEMSALSYRQEILAEDLEEIPGALWKLSTIDSSRMASHPELIRIVVGVDPPGGATECGIVTSGIAECKCKGPTELHGFVLGDRSLKASPEVWGRTVVGEYEAHQADAVLGESNYGGDMVRSTIHVVDPTVNVKMVPATRGKAVRAEPVAALYEAGKVHHVGTFPELEEELTGWVPGRSQNSPNRLDALVWTLTDLLVKRSVRVGALGRPLHEMR